MTIMTIRLMLARRLTSPWYARTPTHVPSVCPAGSSYDRFATGRYVDRRGTRLLMKRFSIAEGNEIRGFMIRLYPDKEQEASLLALEFQVRRAWNWLVKQQEDTIEASAAFAQRNGLVPDRPVRPVYDGMTPDDAMAAKLAYADACKAWRKSVYDATKKAPECSFRKLREQLDHHGVRHDYQLLSRVVRWSKRDGESDVAPGAHMLQALTKNFFQKSDRRKKFRRSIDSMPLQVRSGDCFKIGDFGSRGATHRKNDGEQSATCYYNCQVQMNGIKLRGRLPGRVPGGRVLEGVSITRQPDGWWASVKVEQPKRELPAPVAGTVVGVDVGLDYIAAIAPPSGADEAIYAGIQKRVYNTRGKEYVERIAGRQAAKKPVGRLHQAAAKQMRHKIYNDIVKPLACIEMIKVEKLPSFIGQRGSVKVSTMRLVASMLKERYGDRVREVEPHYTSQDCSQCGHRSKESWSYAHGRYGECPSCGYREDRDLNAARNIAAKEPIPLAA